MNTHYKKKELLHTAFFYLILAGLILFFFSQAEEKHHKSLLQKSISREVIRLHVLANSDTDADQNLKLQVRDAVNDYMQKKLEKVSSVADARNILLSCSPAINTIAAKTIAKQGYDYSVSTSLGISYFPEKTYGDLTFPEGNYEALQIKIGKAQGHNWWCVLFPSLCFTSTNSAVLPEESKTQLKNSLTLEEYNLLLSEPDTEITYRFALWDMLTGKEK